MPITKTVTVLATNPGTIHGLPFQRIELESAEGLVDILQNHEMLCALFAYYKYLVASCCYELSHIRSQKRNYGEHVRTKDNSRLL